MTSSSQSLGFVNLILSEHKYMRDEYGQFKSVDNSTKLYPRVRKWIAYIALHGHNEEIAFYPKVEVYLNDENKGGHHLIEHGIKEYRELDTELKKLAEQPTVTWKQIRKAIEKLIHHLDEEEIDIFKPLQSKLDRNIQLELVEQFIDAARVASDKPHPELSKKPENAPQDNIDIGLAEKH